MYFIEVNMGRSFITLKLIEILEDEKIHKTRELQQVLNLSNSSIRVYIYELKDFGYYVESYRGKNGGYRLTKHRKRCYNLRIW